MSEILWMVESWSLSMLSRLSRATSSRACGFSTLLIASVRATGLKGLVMYLTAPAPSPRNWSRSPTFAVTITTGTFAVAGLDLMCLRMSHPLIFGSMTSRTTQSGMASSMLEMAVGPSCTSVTSMPSS